jgi:Polyketide cyclase / dehydrase and lipid transport
MTKPVFRFVVVLLACGASLLARAEAPLLSVSQSIVISAPAQQVWEVAGDFAGLSRWLPVIPSSRLILGHNREAGAIRELVRLNGTKVEERLLQYDPWNMTFSYTYVGGQPLVSDYLATMIVKDLGNRKTQVDWNANFRRLHYWTEEAPPGQENETLVAAFNRTYSGGLQNLKRVVEEQQ